MASKNKVLVTGVTGFLGSHTTIQLLNKGYEVVGTLRNLEREESIRKVIAQHSNHVNHLHFAEADLLNEKIWDELMPGVDFVMHIASPFPSTLPKREEDLTLPAKNGTLNVLRAAATHGVKRVVLTSSSGSVAYGKAPDKRRGTFTESDWTDISNLKDTTPYFRSKTIAEKAAWDFVKENGNGLELTTICPGAILGPVLEKDAGTSANIVIKTMDGTSPAVPRIGLDLVDVRSVADLHIRAMEKPEAAGERFLGSGGFLTFQEIAAILRSKYPDRKIPKGVLPNWFVRIFSNFEKTLKPILVDLGTERKLDSSKAKEMLGWEPIPNEEAVLACAESLLSLNILR